MTITVFISRVYASNDADLIYRKKSRKTEWSKYDSHLVRLSWWMIVCSAELAIIHIWLTFVSFITTWSKRVFQLNFSVNIKIIKKIKKIFVIKIIILSRYRYRFWLVLPVVHHRDTLVLHRPHCSPPLPQERWWTVMVRDELCKNIILQYCSEGQDHKFKFI